MKNFILVTLLVCLFFSRVQGQKTHVESLKLPNVIPPSPDVFNFANYGNIPLNGSTGGFSYQYPFFTLKTNDLEVKSSLNYFSNGVKVNELSTLVGVGWNLNVGGVVSRVVRDLPDDMVPSSRRWYPQSLNINRDYKKIKTFSRDEFDTEPDWFSFNVRNGISGKFYFDENMKIYVDSQQNLKVTADYRNDILTGFTFIDENGTSYYFGGEDNYIEKTKSRNDCNFNINRRYNSAWFLKSIMSAFGNEIKFTYQSRYLDYIESFIKSYVVMDKCKICRNEVSLKEKDCTINKRTESKVVKSIEVVGGKKILFNYSTENRSDGGGLYLKEVLLQEKNKIIQKFICDYDFVVSNQNYSSFILNGNSSIKQRVFLSSITKYSSSGQKEKPTTFSYFDKEKLPPRFSYSQDKYGYYNARNNYVRPLCKPISDEHIFIKFRLSDKVGNRDVNPNVTHYGMLKRIVYPTGGFTEIEYENNKGMREVKELKYEELDLSGYVNYCSQNEDSSLPPPFIFKSNGGKIEFSVGASGDVCEGVYINPAGGYSFTVYDITDNNKLIHSISNSLSKGRRVTRGYLGRIQKPDEIPYLVDPIQTTKGHKYKIVFSLYAKFSEISGSLSLKYNSYKVTSQEDEFGAGVRVFKIKDVDTEKVYNEREFYYNELKKYPSKESSYSFSYVPICNTKTPLILNCRALCGGSRIKMPWPEKINQYSFFSEPINSYFDNRANTIHYSVITELFKGKETNKGCIERIFYDVGSDQSANFFTDTDYSCLPRSNNTEKYKDQLHYVNYYKFKNGFYKLSKSEKYEYEMFSESSLFSTFLLKYSDFILPSIQKEKSLSNMCVGQYENFLSKKRIKSKEEKLYDLKGGGQ